MTRETISIELEGDGHAISKRPCLSGSVLRRRKPSGGGKPVAHDSKQGIERAQILLAYAHGASVSEIARTQRTNRPRVERTIDKALQIGAVPSLHDLAGGDESVKRPPSRSHGWLRLLFGNRPHERYSTRISRHLCQEALDQNEKHLETDPWYRRISVLGGRSDRECHRNAAPRNRPAFRCSGTGTNGTDQATVKHRSYGGTVVHSYDSKPRRICIVGDRNRKRECPIRI